MKKAAKWLAMISIFIFVIAWGVVGLKILDNNYIITVEAYTGLISIVIFFICTVYIKFTNRCPHCQKINQSFGKYCPYCGKEIN